MEDYSPPNHTHIFIRTQDISMMNPFAWECDCGVIQYEEPV